jgi:membrane-associated phospholipid phosphatase
VRALTAALGLALAACGTLPDGSRWGDGAPRARGGRRARRPAAPAAVDPWTWVPLAAAGLLAFGDVDEDLSDWARRETPIFGSQEDAEDWSDELRGLSRDFATLTLLFTPSGERAAPWLLAKGQGYLVESAATAATSGATSGLKELFGRERPDASDERSFPSGHTSSAFAQAALAWRHIDAVDMPDAARIAARGAVIAAAAGTGWARVEAGKHFPTDVLAGAALGNALTRFVHDAFLLAPGWDAPVEISVGPWPAGALGGGGFAFGIRARR